MIAKVIHKFLRQAFIASKTKNFSHQIKGESVKSIIWWPLVMFVGYKKLRWEMKSESEKMQYLYDEQEKRVSKLKWFEVPTTTSEKIAASIHERVALPIVRKMCDLDWHDNLCSFDIFGLFYPKKPNLFFYIVYLFVSLIGMLVSIFFSLLRK